MQRNEGHTFSGKSKRIWYAFQIYSSLGKLLHSKEYGIDIDAICIKLMKELPKDYQENPSKYHKDHVIPLVSFNHNNIEEIKTVGEKFDPKYHEAIGEEESEKYVAGMVIKEMAGGYKMGDRVIRPAKVIIAK